MEPSINIRAISPAPDGVTLQHVDERLALAFEDETFVSTLIILINILSNHAIKACRKSTHSILTGKRSAKRYGDKTHL